MQKISKLYKCVSFPVAFENLPLYKSEKALKKKEKEKKEGKKEMKRRKKIKKKETEKDCIFHDRVS